MNKRISTGYGLALFEHIIAIGFFALFAVMCMRIFLSTQQISNQNSQLYHAIIAAQNAAECFKADRPPILYYTEAWAPADETSAAYQVDIAVSVKNGIKKADIRVTARDGNKIFSLKADALEDPSQ